MDPETRPGAGDSDASGIGSDNGNPSALPAAPPAEMSAGAPGPGSADVASSGLMRSGAAPALGPREEPAAPLSRQELAAINNELASFFPQPFHETRLVLMVVDPYHVHAYWNVSLDDLDAARRHMGPEGAHAPLVLRFYDITFIDLSRQGPHRSFDVLVHGLHNNWYLDLWQDFKSYVADIGLRKPDGALAALARSNIIHTPRSAESPHYERAGVVLMPDGTQRQVSDFLRGGVMPAAPRQPTSQMARDESESLVRQGYRRLMWVGRPGFRPALWPGPTGTKGEF